MTFTSPAAQRRSPRRRSPKGTSPPRANTNSTNANDVLNPTGVTRRIPYDQEDTDMIDLAPNVLSKICTFLSSQNRVTLRNIGRKWNCRGTGNKKEFLFRNLLFLLNGRRAGRNPEHILRSNEACPSYDEFLKLADGGTVNFIPCPSEESIREHLRSVRDPENIPTRSVITDSPTGNVEPIGAAPHFSISEFARLFVLLRDDHACRNALLKLTQDLKRADFEAGGTRESFWKEIEVRFNNHSLQYHQSFEGSVPEADSAAPPLHYRKLDALKTQLQNARKSFTVVYSNYNKSGQNDPEKWTEFLSTDRNGEFVAASKKCYIIFVVCNLNEEFGKDMFLLNATTKTFEGGDDEGPGEGTSTGSSSSKRKRMSADARATMTDKRWEGLNEFMRETQKQGALIQESITTKQPTLTDFADVAQRDSVLEIIEKTYNRYVSARENGADEKFVGFLKANYEKALDRYVNMADDQTNPGQ